MNEELESLRGALVIHSTNSQPAIYGVIDESSFSKGNRIAVINWVGPGGPDGIGVEVLMKTCDLVRYDPKTGEVETFHKATKRGAND